MNLILQISCLIVATAFTPLLTGVCGLTTPLTTIPRNVLLSSAIQRHSASTPLLMSRSDSTDELGKVSKVDDNPEGTSNDPFSTAASTSYSTSTSNFASDLPSPPSLEEVSDLVKSATTDLFSDFDGEMIKANLLDGEVGERGEAWTAAWLFLVFCIASGGIPITSVNNALTFLGGPGLMIAGVAILSASLGNLGDKNLTPFLAPTSGGNLVEDGLYSKIRHPMYAGLIALCAGFSIFTESAPRLIFTALLIYVLDVKAETEEEFLAERYPEYTAYKAKVTGKFFPGDLSFQQKYD